MLKKFLFLFLSVALISNFYSVVFAGSSVVFAGSNEIVEINPARNDRIFELYDKRNALLQSNISRQELFEVERELKGLGVEFLSTNEVLEQHGDDLAVAQLAGAKISKGIGTYVVAPDKKNIVWSSFRSDFTKNGIVYEVQHLTAASNNQSSTLKGSHVATVTYKNSFEVGATNLMITSAKEVTSNAVPVLGIAITFYDAVKGFIKDSNFSKTTVVNNVSVSYTTNQYQTIDYMYVKKKSDPDKNQQLTFVTNDVKGDTTANIPIFTYGSNGATSGSETIVTKKSFEYKAAKHRDGSQAVASYLDFNQPRQSFVRYFYVQGPGNTNVHSIPLTVVTAPGSLY